MGTAFPSGLDDFTNPAGSDPLSTGAGHAAQHGDLNDAVEAIEAALGTDPQGAYATVKAWLTALAAATGGAKPYQFAVSDYGAVGDGRVVSDLHTTNGSGVVTSDTAAFTADDVGRSFLVMQRAQATPYRLLTTVASYQSATQVTLTANVSGTYTNAHAVIATDDTAAIKDAVAAAYSYAIAHGFYAEVVFDDAVYGVATAPVTTAHGNAQIPLPWHSDATSGGRKVGLALKGAGASSSALYHWYSTVPQQPGTVLVGMRTDGSDNATYGPTSVIGGPTYAQGYGGMGTHTWDNLILIVDGISVQVPWDSTYCGFDLTCVAEVKLPSLSCQALEVPSSMSGQQGNMAHFYAFGLGLPGPGNNAHNVVGEYTAEGLPLGLLLCGEHTVVNTYRGIYDWCAIYGKGIGSTPIFSASIMQANIEVCEWAIDVFNGTGSAAVQFNIFDLEIELLGGLIYDPGDRLRGEVHIRGGDGQNWQGGANTGAYVRIYDHYLLTPGVQTAPSVPASTTRLVNPFLGLMAVNVYGGTVTNIQVARYPGGTQTSLGITSGTVMLAPNTEITLTYSSAPSWSWVLV